MTSVTISICMGSACFARGNAENLSFIEKYLKEKGIDAKINVIGERCRNLCADGPNIYIGTKRYQGVTPEKLQEILDGLFA